MTCDCIQLTFVISTSLISNNRLSRSENLVPDKHENLTTGKKYCWKEEKLFLRSNFSSFPQYFQYTSNFKSPVTHIFVKCGCSSNFFLNSSKLICRSTDILKYFRESLGIRDNESRLYFTFKTFCFYSSWIKFRLFRRMISKYNSDRGHKKRWTSWNFNTLCVKSTDGDVFLFPPENKVWYSM